MFKGTGKIVRDNKSSSYPIFELTVAQNSVFAGNIKVLRKLFCLLTRTMHLTASPHVAFFALTSTSHSVRRIWNKGTDREVIRRGSQDRLMSDLNSETLLTSQSSRPVQSNDDSFSESDFSVLAHSKENCGGLLDYLFSFCKWEGLGEGVLLWRHRKLQGNSICHKEK